MTHVQVYSYIINLSAHRPLVQLWRGSFPAFRLIQWNSLLQEWRVICISWCACSQWTVFWSYLQGIYFDFFFYCTKKYEFFENSLCINSLELYYQLSFFSQYPGLLSGCAINWMCDWPQEALLGEASYFITRYQLTEEFENLRFIFIKWYTLWA